MVTRKPAQRRYPWLRIENFDRELDDIARRAGLPVSAGNRAVVRDAYVAVMEEEYPDVDLQIMSDGEVHAAQPRPDGSRAAMDQIFRDRFKHADGRLPGP